MVRLRFFLVDRHVIAIAKSFFRYGTYSKDLNPPYPPFSKGGDLYRVAVKHVILVTGVVGAGSPRPWNDDWRMAGGETPPLLV